MSNLPEHLGGHGNITHTDEGALLVILALYPDLTEVVDIGCGPGGMKAICEAHGLRYTGVDGDWTMHPDICHDYTTGIAPLFAPALGAKRLVWSVEFVEHVEEKHAQNFLCDFATADVVFMTHAVPGQAGHHHVNCQSQGYWVDHLSKHGFTLDQGATDAVRAAGTDQYVIATGMVFVKQGAS